MSNRLNGLLPEPQPGDGPGLAFVTDDPIGNVLYTGMKRFWQGYFLCQTALYAHIDETLAALSAEQRDALRQKVVAMAVYAAQHQPLTARQLEECFETACQPLLAALAAAELEQDTDSDDGNAE